MQKKKLIPSTLYDVGYGKPPEDFKFEKGKSGNPKGRPKGSKNKNPLIKPDQFNHFFSQSMQSPVSDNDETEEPTKTVYIALLDKLKELAFGGDLKAIQFLIKTSHTIDYAERLRSEKIVEKMHEYKVITTMEIKRRQYQGYSIDHILPHPDHVHIDLKNCEVFIRGPSNKKEKNLWDIIHSGINELVERIKSNTRKILNPENKKDYLKIWKLISTDINYLHKVKVYFDGWDIIIPWDVVNKCKNLIKEKFPNL